MPYINEILLVIRGGVIQSVYSTNDHTTVTILDYDEAEENGNEIGLDVEEMDKELARAESELKVVF